MNRAAGISPCQISLVANENNAHESEGGKKASRDKICSTNDAMRIQEGSFGCRISHLRREGLVDALVIHGRGSHDGEERLGTKEEMFG